MKTGYGNDQPAGAVERRDVSGSRSWQGGGQGGSGGGGRGAAVQTAAQVAAIDAERKWRTGLSMDIFKELRKLYNDAGVTIYALNDLPAQGTDEQMDYTFTVAKTLGAKMVTVKARGPHRSGYPQTARGHRSEAPDVRDLSHACAGQHDRFQRCF